MNCHVLILFVDPNDRKRERLPHKYICTWMGDLQGRTRAMNLGLYSRYHAETDGKMNQTVNCHTLELSTRLGIEFIEFIHEANTAT